MVGSVVVMEPIIPVRYATSTPEWYENAKFNEYQDSTIEDWFAEILNCKVDISQLREVYSYTGQYWLDQDEIDDICKRIDAMQPSDPNDLP